MSNALPVRQAKSIAASYYTPGTVKHDILVELMTCKYPQTQQSLQGRVCAERITNRINEIVAETTVVINRTKAVMDAYSNGKPVNLYSIDYKPPYFRAA